VERKYIFPHQEKKDVYFGWLLFSIHSPSSTPAMCENKRKRTKRRGQDYYFSFLVIQKQKTKKKSAFPVTK
jgi:hypothetical protein